MRLGQEADGFVHCASAFDHVQWARFGDQVGVKLGIFAGEIEFPEDGGRGNLVLVGGGGIFPGLGEIEGEKEGGGGENYEAHYNFHKAPLMPQLPLIPPVDRSSSDR